MTKLELNISASNLADKDTTSKSDPMCVVFLKDATQRYVEVGRTERIMNSLSPAWSQSIQVNYYFEERQQIKFEIYDSDSSSSRLDAHDFLGLLECSLGEIVSTPVRPFTRPLARGKGSIIVTAKEDTGVNEDVFLTFSAKNVDKKDFFGKSDPFFVISRPAGAAWTVVHRSEVIKDTLNPSWRPFIIPLSKLLANNDRAADEFKIEVFDWDSDGGHDFIGAFVTTFARIEAGDAGDGHLFPLISEKKKAKKGSSYKNSGIFCVDSVRTQRCYSFLDYIQGGTSLHFTVAVDFTGSNGDPRDPRSLHYNDPSYPNQYIQAIRSVGEIIQDYDTDKLFPALGFGGKLPDGRVSHEFFLNGHPSNPYCERVEGILAAYASALQSVQLYGPTNFSPVINHVARFAREAGDDGRNYFALLIITDGIITDMAETINAIIAASHLAMSIIIIGVGDADFSAMSTLDGDGERLRSGGNVASRDIVQFVQFSDYCVTERSHSAASTLFVQNQAKLAKAVLAEVPLQLTEYMKYRNIVPPNQIIG